MYIVKASSVINGKRSEYPKYPNKESGKILLLTYLCAHITLNCNEQHRIYSAEIYPTFIMDLPLGNALRVRGGSKETILLPSRIRNDKESRITMKNDIACFVSIFYPQKSRVTGEAPWDT